MKNFFALGAGFVLAIAMASPNCQAVIYQFDGSVDNAFLTSGNWSIPPGQTPDLGVPDDGTDRAIVNDGLTANYGTAVTSTIGSLIVGADWPVTGDTGTKGTLNVTAGKMIITGPGDSFQVSRGCCGAEGSAINVTGAEIEISGSDPIVGTRDQGTLDIGLNGKVYNTAGRDNYWRLGNYGPSFIGDLGGLQGNGLLNVHSNGTFNGHVIFIGDNDATGEVRVSDTGSVVLTGNLLPRPSGFQAQGSATIRMNGSGATLSAYNLESESLAGEIATQYDFTADAGGVSDIFLRDAINITNNSLTVDLTSFAMAPSSTLLLFDGDHTGAGDTPVGNRIFGNFSSVNVLGGASPSNYYMIYDQPSGDILLARTVPEPSTVFLFGLGISVVLLAKRRNTR